MPVDESKIEERLDAIEYLVRGEMYFVRKDIKTDKEERQQFIKKLNETLVKLMDNAVVNNTKTTEMQVFTEAEIGNMEKLIKKVGQNSVAIKAISQTLFRNRRGLMGEKKARKSDAKEVIAHLKLIEQNQIKILQNQNETISKLDQTMSDHENLVNQVQYITQRIDEIHNTSEELEQKTDFLQETLEAQQIEIASFRESQLQLMQSDNDIQELVIDTRNDIGEVKTATANIKQDLAPKLYCGRNNLSLDACLQRHFTQQFHHLMSISSRPAVRLVGGSNEYEGRVEVSYNREYGTVCDDGWGDSEAQVVCRMLGYTGSTGYIGYWKPFRSSHVPQHNYGAGTGKILLDNVDCRGDEGSLFSCYHNDIGVHDCTHSEDAGVRCDP